MKWLNNLIYKAYNSVERENCKSEVVSSDNDLSNDGMNITLHPAIGGTVVKIRNTTNDEYYGNNTKGNSGPNLYLITEEEDFTESLAGIITTEKMKQ